MQDTACNKPIAVIDFANNRIRIHKKTIISLGSPESILVKINIPFLANIFVTKEYEKYPLLNDETTYYICKDHVCMPPTNILH